MSLAKMLVFKCMVLSTILAATGFGSAGHPNQFWCALSSVCVEKANNLTECNCTVQGFRYCPTNSTCLPNDNYNENACWQNASCSNSVVPTTTTSIPTASTTGTIMNNVSGNTSVSANTSVTHVTQKPTPTTKPTTLYELDTNYMPIIATVAAGFGGFIVFVCCMCAIHSWWLKRKKYTDVNSRTLTDVERKKKKRELREARRQEKEEQLQKEPSRFDMGYRKHPTVNERALANYDWARTSYLPGMLEPTVHDPNPAGSLPKLICDDEDTDTGELDANVSGEENNGYEREQDNPRNAKSPSIASFSNSSLFSKEGVEPQEPVVVEPEIFESMEELPRPPPDGDMDESVPNRQSQDYRQMMARF